MRYQILQRILDGPVASGASRNYGGKLTHLGRRLILPVSVVLLAVLVGAAPALGTFPGRNGRIAFAGEATDGQENPVMTVNRDGTDLRFLAYGHNPAWSADGRRIAFESHGRIYIMRADGQDRQRVGPVEAWAATPAWAPDGKRLAVHTDSGLEVVDIATGRRSLPVGTSFANAYATWSPDGTLIAFASGEQNEIYVVHPDGTGLRNITNSPDRESGDLDWSPDGERLTYLSQSAGQICRIGYRSMRKDGTDRTDIWVASCGSGSQLPSFVTHLPTGEVVLPGWDTSTGERAPIVTGPSGPIYGFNPVWQPLPEPQRSEYKNASAYCKALRESLGAPDFAARYRNHGACVSRNH